MRKIEFMLPHWGYPIPMCFLNFQPTRFCHLDSFIANIYIHTHTYIYKLYDINYRYTNNNIQIFSSFCVNFQKKKLNQERFQLSSEYFPSITFSCSSTISYNTSSKTNKNESKSREFIFSNIFPRNQIFPLRF